MDVIDIISCLGIKLEGEEKKYTIHIARIIIQGTT